MTHYIFYLYRNTSYPNEGNRFKRWIKLLIYRNRHEQYINTTPITSKNISNIDIYKQQIYINKDMFPFFLSFNFSIFLQYILFCQDSSKLQSLLYGHIHKQQNFHNYLLILILLLTKLHLVCSYAIIKTVHLI